MWLELSEQRGKWGEMGTERCQEPQDLKRFSKSFGFYPGLSCLQGSEQERDRGTRSP